MPSIEMEIPDPPPSDEREFILRDCADRLANLGDTMTVEEMSALMIERLAERSGHDIIRYTRLGKVISNLAEELDGDTSKGLYGIGKIFRAPFQHLDDAKGRPGVEAVVEKATNDLIDKFLSVVFRLADVER